MLNMFETGEQVRDQRKHLGKTQDDIASDIGISKKTIAKMENGDGGQISFGTAIAILNSTNWDLEIRPKIMYRSATQAGQYEELFHSRDLR